MVWGSDDTGPTCMARPVVEHQPSDELRVLIELVSHVHDLNLSATRRPVGAWQEDASVHAGSMYAGSIQDSGLSLVTKVFQQPG